MADRSVYFAKVTRAQTGAFDRTFEEDIFAALDPSEETTRYRKRWRLSRPQLTPGFIVGKLGFVRTAKSPETRYDDDLQDFVTGEAIANQGSFSMFAIDTRTEIMAFEERLPDIRRQSFLGAFKSLAREADVRWEIDLLSDPTGYREFVATLDRVQRIRTVTFAPNPGYHKDAENLEAIIQQSGADRAEVIVVSPPGGSLDPNAHFVQGALGQASEHGKGTVKVTGYRNEHKRTWTLGARLQIAVISEGDAITPEGVWDWMRRQLRERFRG